MSSVLRDTHLIDLATPSISYDKQVQAGSTAFDNQMFEIIDVTPEVLIECLIMAGQLPSPTPPVLSPSPLPPGPIIDPRESLLTDILAWQFHVDFYDQSADLEFRKQLVRNSIQWHMRKGTVQLVQDVLDFYFPKAATIQEWFEYMDPFPPNYPVDDADVLNRTFGPSQVNDATDKFLFTGHGLANGDQVRFENGSLSVGGHIPSPLVPGIYYFVVNALTNSFQVSPSSGGSPVDLTDDGVGSNNECWKRGLGSWHDRYRFRILIDESLIPPDLQAKALRLINNYKPISRWCEGFVRAIVSNCDIGWYGAMLRFVYYLSDEPDRGGFGTGDFEVTLPDTPVLVSAVPSYSDITLTWDMPTPSPTSVAPSIAGFNIYRGTSAGHADTIFSAPPDATTYVDASAVTGTTYYYRVAAISGGIEGAPSNELSAARLVFIDVLTDLLGHWKLDEVGGATPRAESRGIGALALGQVPNTSDYSGTPGIIGNSHGSGGACYLTTPDSPDWNFAGSVTFTGWLDVLSWGPHQLAGMFTKWAGDGGCQCALFLNNYATPAQWMFMASKDGMGSGAGVVGVTSTEGNSINAWHFVVAWYDDAAHQLGIQIDNGTVFTTPFTGPIFHSATGASLHTFYDGVTIYQSLSLLDEFTVHNGRVLPPLERAWLYNSGAGRPFSSYT